MGIKLPDKGYVFWPVGTGDSSTVVVKKDEIVLQIDLHHLSKSDNVDDPHCAIVDELVDCLPKKDRKPFLAVFVLTHPDKDHIKGFADLLDKVMVGEIWHTPRIFREYKKDLCDDAVTFKDEVARRRDKTIKDKGNVGPGDMIRVIGHDVIFESGIYKDFPDYWRTYPGNTITEINNESVEDDFTAFVHAPFKDDTAAERNDTSLALQVEVKDSDGAGKALFFGDRAYPTIKQIFDKTKEKDRTEYLEWNVMLSSHHCSKKVMYWKGEDDETEKLKQDILDAFEEYRLNGAYIIASSESDFSDEEGKNPPHLKARKRYEEIIEADHFKCTHEHPNQDNPTSIIFEVGSNGFSYQESGDSKNICESGLGLGLATREARGEDEPPSEKAGFGTL
jgi:hypothetical protein